MGPTWLVVWVFESIQPIKAENLLPVWALHQRKLAGIDLHLGRSVVTSALLLLSPRASNSAGP